jgi:hypothetical protein
MWSVPLFLLVLLPSSNADEYLVGDSGFESSLRGAIAHARGQNYSNASDEFQEYLRNWQEDPSLPVARGFDLSESDGGISSIFQDVVSSMYQAILEGRRAARPRNKWQYASLMADSGLCEESEGWGCVFDWSAGEVNSSSQDAFSVDLSRKPTNIKLSNDERTFLESQLLRFVWKPAEILRAQVSQTMKHMNWPPFEQDGSRSPVLAVHIRRGDACSCQGLVCKSTANDGPRLCLPVDNYMQSALKLQAQSGVHHLLVVTESSDVITAIEEQWGDNFTIHHCPWDRTGYTSAVTNG